MMILPFQLKTAENDAGENKSVKASEDAKDTQKLPSHATKCNIYQLKTFLETLVSDPDLKCKICVKRSDTVGLSSVKAFILNPAQMFKDVVSQSRSVVLAGGYSYKLTFSLISKHFILYGK